MTPREETKIMFKIVDRAMLEVFSSIGEKRINVLMDLDNTHDIIPLDLPRLLTAPTPDFVHDMAGIYRHFNRQTMEMDGCFLPRYALPAHNQDGV